MNESFDVRDGSSWTRAQQAKNALIYLFVTAIVAATNALPQRVLPLVGRLAAALAYVLFSDARRTAHANVARVFPSFSASARRALVFRCYRTCGESLADTLLLLRARSRGAPIAIADSALETLRAAAAEGRGIVFASAHLGPWERIAAALIAAGIPLTAVARESYDPRFAQIYDRLRGGSGVKTIYRGAPGAGFAMVRVLRRGGVLGVPMDLRSRVESIVVPFLGHPALTPVGPARIAIRTGAAVVVGTAARAADGGFCVTATRIYPTNIDREPQGERELTERINAELSARILALPEAWVWMHPRFSH